MKISFFGAAQTVTGSKYMVEHAGHRMLLDCGLFQGYKTLRERNWAALPFDPRAVEAVVLTHAHLDHSGFLPLLVKRGFVGPIYCTEATAELCRILLPDSAHLQEEDAERANRRGYSKHRPALPLYNRVDADRALKLLAPRPFASGFTAAPGLDATFLPAGHILGASTVTIRAPKMSVAFTGDLGRLEDPIMRPPEAIPGADYMIVESTYGDRLHDRSDPHEALGAIIAKVAARGGVVVIPSFAVGRTQSLLWCINRLKADGRLPQRLPVYLNSPMATDVTKIYHRHRTEHRLSHEECDAMCHAAEIVNSVADSKALNMRKGPMVIIAGSGMATGGRVVHHLKAFAADPRNAVVFAGFQAGGTRGAAMLAGAETIRIHGEDVPVKAEIAMLSNLSGHADYGEMLDWLRRVPKAPRRVFITHGELAAADALRTRIERELGWDCRVPAYLESVELTAGPT